MSCRRLLAPPLVVDMICLSARGRRRSRRGTTVCHVCGRHFDVKLMMIESCIGARHTHTQRHYPHDIMPDTYPAHYAMFSVVAGIQIKQLNGGQATLRGLPPLSTISRYMCQVYFGGIVNFILSQPQLLKVLNFIVIFIIFPHHHRCHHHLHSRYDCELLHFYHLREIGFYVSGSLMCAY